MSAHTFTNAQAQDIAAAAVAYLEVLQDIALLRVRAAIEFNGLATERQAELSYLSTLVGGKLTQLRLEQLREACAFDEHPAAGALFEQARSSAERLLSAAECAGLIPPRAAADPARGDLS